MLDVVLLALAASILLVQLLMYMELEDISIRIREVHRRTVEVKKVR